MTRTLTLTDEQVALLVEALDSHKYWQLSDSHYRSNGGVLEPGSDDDGQRAEIEACEELEAILSEVGTR
jgi:hypothetical protein